MKRTKALLAVMLGIFFLAGCSLNYTPNDQALSETEGQETSAAVTRASGCAGQPPTKTVTTTAVRTKTYPVSDIRLSDISTGSESLFYTDGCCHGVLYSVSFIVNYAPTINGDYITFNLTITFTGTVTCPTPTPTPTPNPCDELPFSKSVTETRSTTRTYLVYDIGLGDISSGSESLYYSDECYSGTIRSTSYSVTSPPTVDGDYITFPLTITYNGTVYKY